MRIIVNGVDRLVVEGTSILTVLTELGKRVEHVAVECNGELVDASEFASRALCAEDRLEIVHFVGGG